MYGKFFSSAFDGSMYGAGPDVFALWAYVISHTVNSRVEVNPVAVAPKIGMSVEEAEKALEYLQRPDPRSRSKEYEGKRMVKEGEYSYFIPNHRTYLLIRSSEDLREYNARKQREHRAKKAETGLGGLTPQERLVYEKAQRKEFKKRRKTVEYEGACDGAKRAIRDGLEEAAQNGVVEKAIFHSDEIDADRLKQVLEEQEGG